MIKLLCEVNRIIQSERNDIRFQFSLSTIQSLNYVTRKVNVLIEQLKMQISGVKLYYVDWNRLINCGIKQGCLINCLLISKSIGWNLKNIVSEICWSSCQVDYLFILSNWKRCVIGASCFRVRVLCVVISVKSLFTKFIWTTEKLSDWWFKIFVMRWYYWRSKRQRESWVGDKCVLSIKLISF